MLKIKEESLNHIVQFIKKWIYDGSTTQYENPLSFEKYAVENNYRFHYSPLGVPIQQYWTKKPIVNPKGIIIFTNDSIISRQVPKVNENDFSPEVKPVVLFYRQMPDEISDEDWRILSRVPIFFLWQIDDSILLDDVIKKIIDSRGKCCARNFGYIFVSRDRSNPQLHICTSWQEFSEFCEKREKKRQDMIRKVIAYPMSKKPSHAWLLQSESSADDVTTFSLLLLKHLIVSTIFPSYRILHFYKPDGRVNLDQKLAQCEIQYTPQINLLEGSIKNSSYFGFQLSNMAKDNNDTASVIERFLYQINPDLIIFDAPFLSKADSAVGKIISNFSSSSARIVWVCARPNSSFFLWPTECIAKISKYKITSGQYLLSGKIHKQFSDGIKKSDWIFSDKYSFVFRNQNLPKSTENNDISTEITRLTSDGLTEQKIAEIIKIKPHTVARLKRCLGLRVNAPLKHKRRTGLDMKIIALYQKQFSIQNIAKKLRCRPSYIKKRIDIWEKKQVEQGVANETI